MYCRRLPPVEPATFPPVDLASAAVSGPFANPDCAGVTNFQRYAFGLAARGPVAAPPPVSIANVRGDRFLTLTFNRRAAAATLSYILEASTDLITRTPVPGQTFTPSVTASVTAEDTVAVGVPGAARRFLSIRLAAP